MTPRLSMSTRRAGTRRPSAPHRHALTLAATALAVTGCAGTVSLEPAELSNDVACAEISVRLPDTVGELDRRTTNAQATAAWGEPTAVIYRCGLPPIGPSDLPCFTIDDVDWLLDESNAPQFVFLSYGREPVTEIIVDPELAGISGADVIRELSPAVRVVEPEQRCLAATDVFGGGSIEPPADDSTSDAPDE